MKRSFYLVLLLLCVLKTIESYRHPQHQLNNVSSNNEVTIDEEQKLLLQCQHTDYRTYIKCLKREKRQHHGNGFGNSRACLDECFEGNCTNSTCLRDCHFHCRKRFIETYSKTVETSYDCADGECNEIRGSNSPNITTIVNITNLLPNITKTLGDTASEQSSSRDRHKSNDTVSGHGNTESSKDSSHENNSKFQLSPKIDINNIINNQFGSGFYSNTDCACSGCNCYPYNPWLSSPQITIGIGGGPVGGCMYSIPWPCFQRFPTPPVDCSTCNNPFMRYRCDPICSTDSRQHYTESITERPLTSIQ